MNGESRFRVIRRMGGGLVIAMVLQDVPVQAMTRQPSENRTYEVSYKASSVGKEAQSWLRIRSHPPGTLLIDQYQDYWMVDAWPLRERVSIDEISAFRRNQAVEMTSDEALCLRDADDELSTFAAQGQLEGLLVRTETRLGFVHGDWFHPFIDEALARTVGYRPEFAFEIPEATLTQMLHVGFVLTPSIFSVCPDGVTWP